MKLSGHGGWLVCDTFFNKQGTHRTKPAKRGAFGVSLFTCVPKTFSRKLFMHFEGIEQLAKEKRSGARRKPVDDSFRRSRFAKNG